MPDIVVNTLFEIDQVVSFDESIIVDNLIRYLEPNYIDKKKYLKKGIFSGFIIIIITLILGIPFIFRTKFLEYKKSKIKIFSDEYDVLVKKLNKESKELKEISKFNSDLKNAIINISSSSALFQEIALIIPKMFNS